jgi:formylglycine-generating enzyme required for sulfatase activity
VKGMSPSTLGWGPDDRAYAAKYIVYPVDGAEMVWVPPGSFSMGFTVAERDRLWRDNNWPEEWKYTVRDVAPPHRVTLTRGFWLYRHAVAGGQYERFLAQSQPGPAPLKTAAHDHPLVPVGVCWNDAYTYCRWAGGQLPTEAQREWAARGPHGYLFPWGNTWNAELCNCGEHWAGKQLLSYDDHKAWFGPIRPDRYPFYQGAIGASPGNRSWCGATDLVGKHWEWCWDWSDNGDRGSTTPAVDPEGPPGGTERIVRGGGWSSFSHNSLAVYRSWHKPDEAASVAFRLAVRP